MAARAKSPSRRSNKSSVYVALLRGINVGGKNLLPMRDLQAIFAEAACTDVRTYIQSGNVVFAATPTCAQRVAKVVGEGITQRFGYRVPVVVRAAEELAEVAASNPFLAKADADTGPLHVAFLADAPDARRIAALDPKRSPGDRFQVRGREIYLCLPNGMGRTKLTNNYFDSKLATTSTMRNWRTVLKLMEIAHAMG